MGNRGPQRKSAAWMAVNGARAGDNRGIATPPGVPVKPDWIAAKPIASTKWDETIAELSELPGLLSTLDGDVLSLYADYWQQFHDAEAIIAEDGMVCQSEKGGTYQHPAVGIRGKAKTEIIRIGAMFGLNPVAREGMVIESPEDDELSRLMR